ncbi:hypothetical protein KNN17_21385 [Arthrobacter bambusae]|uniref:hypothetical protein n=1 Tax=Arthrobacter bambusae TaxID=1338426 RepID=UPI001F50EDCB|nr:hypothetical protein [Arthrobacter bambusae]MCI0144106.1 hypothetical protein [Arthrobacter bambusae]
MTTALRSSLRGDPELSESFISALFHQVTRPDSANPTAGYAAGDYRQIVDEARRRVRHALARIRSLRDQLESTPESEFDERMSLLTTLRATGSVERILDLEGVRAKDRPRIRMPLTRGLFPSRDEIAALVLLFVATTGQNPSTVARLSAEHLRSTDDSDSSGDVIFTRTSKPRRGAHSSEMTAALQHGGIDEFTGEYVRQTDDLRSEAGLYRIALELCDDLRRIAGSSHLILWLRGQGSLGRIVPFNPSHVGPFLAYEVNGVAITVRLSSIRKHHLELTQRPVDHTATTLASTYLRRNAAALPEYQKVVGRVLDDVVREAQASNKVKLMSDQDLAEAFANPKGLAKRLGLNLETLQRVMAGATDTVATACSGPRSTPYPTDSAGYCTASFLLCLGCPCAVSEPRHHPIQALLWKMLDERRQELTPEEWNGQYGSAFSQLTDLLDIQSVDIEEAAKLVSGTDRRLLESLLTGQLEIR